MIDPRARRAPKEGIFCDPGIHDGTTPFVEETENSGVRPIPQGFLYRTDQELKKRQNPVALAMKAPRTVLDMQIARHRQRIGEGRKQRAHSLAPDIGRDCVHRVLMPLSV